MYVYMCTVHVLCSVHVHIHLVITRLSGCFHTTAMDTSPFVHVCTCTVLLTLLKKCIHIYMYMEIHVPSMLAIGVEKLTNTTNK